MATPIDLTVRHAEALEKAQKHWAQRRREATAPAPTAITIALARDAGCPGFSIAHEVGARLGWPVYGHELLEIIAQEMGLRVQLLESIDERRQSWMLEAFETFGEADFVSENRYVRHLIQTILSLGAHGQCVIVGRGAAQILPAQTTLRVRIIGRREDRIAALASRENIAHQEAAHKVDATDRERVGFIKDHFQKDPTDIYQYDLLLNTSRWSVGECADMILRAQQELQAKLVNPGFRTSP